MYVCACVYISVYMCVGICIYVYEIHIWNCEIYSQGISYIFSHSEYVEFSPQIKTFSSLIPKPEIDQRIVSSGIF